MEGMTLLFTICGAATLAKGMMKVFSLMER